jgi:hypothetical protein
MRLWTLHPKHLDARGLVALWREGLLAQAVLRGQTRGYQHHPQLERFRAAASPVSAIAEYLRSVADEATHRGYQFDRTKLARVRTRQTLSVTRGQLGFEWSHLRAKVRARDPRWWGEIRSLSRPELHPMFRAGRGGIEPWERGAG